MYGGCFSSELAGSTQYGWTCTAVSGATPCGYDDFTTQTTANQPTGKWVGEDEYGGGRLRLRARPELRAQAALLDLLQHGLGAGGRLRRAQDDR